MYSLVGSVSKSVSSSSALNELVCFSLLLPPSFKDFDDSLASELFTLTKSFLLLLKLSLCSTDFGLAVNFGGCCWFGVRDWICFWLVVTFLVSILIVDDWLFPDLFSVAGIKSSTLITFLTDVFGSCWLIILLELEFRLLLLVICVLIGVSFENFAI